MKKRVFVAFAMLATSVAIAQNKKEKQPPPPPPAPPVTAVTEMKAPPPPPTPPPKPNKYREAFMQRNPTVKEIERNNETVRIQLKSGKEEVYNLKSEQDMLKFKQKYGELPVPPPTPPPPPKPAKVKTVS